MTVGVILPNIENKRSLVINFYGGAVVPLHKYMSEQAQRDHLRVYIDGKQHKDSPRITYTSTNQGLEIVLAFPSFQKDRMGRRASFSVVFSNSDNIINEINSLKDHYPNFKDDFENAVDYLQENLSKLIQTIEDSNQVSEYGEILNANTPIYSNSKKKLLTLSLIMVALILLAIQIYQMYSTNSKMP